MLPAAVDAVARAVKTFLDEHGIAVSTLVRQGSMVTGIDLRPPSGEWSADEMARMRELLPGLKVWHSESAQLEPWETVGESYDPYGDYRGKSAALLIPVEHLSRFAAILAGTMKAEGQALNALGERRLAASSPVRAAIVTDNRGGATADQRAGGRGLPGPRLRPPGLRAHPRGVRPAGALRSVVQRLSGPDPFAFNGGRWARGQRPPEPVLAAIRDRGVATFS